MKQIYATLLFAFLFLQPVQEVIAQRKKKTISYKESIYSGMEYRPIGPFRGGRAGTVSGVLNHPNLYYMGTAGGGVWKTTDAGNTWECISDGFFGGSIGAIAVSESDPNIIYVGEGEQTLRGNVSSGKGLWKSMDAGETWEFIGLKDSEHIARIRIHPKNPDLVYVAAIGNLWKPNETRGVYRSKDGGDNWEKVLYVSDKAGAGDLILDPNNSRIIYASTWEMKRNGYRMDSGGPDSKLFKSTDGGDTWKDISTQTGLPGFPWGIVGITVSPIDSNRVWALIEAEDGGLFRSDDAGATWEKINENRALRQRAWYYTRIYADTQNMDKLYVMNVSYGVSTDGGKTFTLKNAPHGDHHDLWIDPQNNQRMIIADDGGAQISNDGGNNWTTYYNQPTAQFYRIATDSVFPYRIYGAQQDNTALRISHRSSGEAITERDWEPTAGGESAHLAPDPKNNQVVYGGTYKGYMNRLDHTTGQARSTNVWPDNPAGSGAEIMKYRFNWNYPVAFSRHDPNKLYAGSNFLNVTTDEGQSWKTISPDLTRGLPETIKSSGGPITQDNTGAEFYSNIFVISESILEKDVIWTGSDDGLIHVTKDSGTTWENVTPPSSMSPKLNMINSIDPSPFHKGTVYVAATAYKFGDYTPYLYKTTDYGKTWSLITNGIKDNFYTRVIRTDHVREGLLYAGTEWGMYISFDDGKSWSPFQLNLPITAIRDLHVRDNDLIVATHGRSFWVIDDLTPLHQLSQEVAESDFYLFKPDTSYRMHQSGGRTKPNTKLVGTNHPDGVIINFFLDKFQEKDTVLLDILETNGTMIQRYATSAKEDKLDPAAPKPLTVKTGGNTMVWDMRYPGYKTFEGMIFYSSPNKGPKAVPGNYKLKLTVNGVSQEQGFSIVKDPRLPNTPNDYQEQFDFLIEVRDQVTKANEAIIKIRSIQGDLKYLKDKTKEYSALQELITEYESELSVIENNIHMTKNKSRQDPLNYGIRINNRLAFLLADSQRGDYPPTQQAKAFFKEIADELDVEIKDLDNLVKKQTAIVNSKVAEEGIKIISPTP
ncbi:WD40/YVTN/BNR-like repeat-containing protein [Maribacter polysaccharolyticus]|uniref:WD40/YVTN/BNR-like repeat-containing protein n=1 Tax=Maribacter polysaccharolyticus TaxID=3020831 RepID=UPI00237F1DB7|nr:exo-alpha-sialidase [Maribacter polysaccharolyticus]MDE3742850.1 glycosyl hydrolase [Maribacter polysaccharolyticus]